MHARIRITRSVIGMPAKHGRRASESACRAVAPSIRLHRIGQAQADRDADAQMQWRGGRSEEGEGDGCTTNRSGDDAMAAATTAAAATDSSTRADSRRTPLHPFMAVAASAQLHDRLSRRTGPITVFSATTPTANSSRQLSALHPATPPASSSTRSRPPAAATDSDRSCSSTSPRLD